MNCIHTTAFYPQKISAYKEKSEKYLEKSFRKTCQPSESKAIPLGYDGNWFGAYEREDLISPLDGPSMDLRSHLSVYFKDYVTYAFWITLLFILVLTLGTIANSEKGIVRDQDCVCPNFAKVCIQCNNQTWFSVPLSYD